MRRLLAIALIPTAFVLAACGSSNKSDTAATSPGPTSTQTTPATPAPSTQATPTQAGGNPPVTANGCQQVPAPPPKPDGVEKRPTAKLDTSKTWTLVVRTSCGLFTITLDPRQSPNATASMVALAKSGFFKNTVFHRIVPGFVIQAGDPTGSDPTVAGQGGPGYSTHDKVPANAKYTRGVVAMAKAGPEPAGTAGSQFYVVTGADAGLMPEFAVIGKVTKGLATVMRIGKLGDQNEQPTQPVIVYDIKARGAK
jgi:peptidyl-prolyl cis-trans isomerase B (cyclophilin B)